MVEGRGAWSISQFFLFVFSVLERSIFAPVHLKCKRNYMGVFGFILHFCVLGGRPQVLQDNLFW